MTLDRGRGDPKGTGQKPLTVTTIQVPQPGTPGELKPPGITYLLSNPYFTTRVGQLFSADSPRWSSMTMQLDEIDLNDLLAALSW